MVAEVSASLAHEINQPLAAIVSNAHACQRWLTSEPPNMERARLTAERLRRDASSAAELVDRIRRLFRRTPPSRIALDINAAIERTLELLADRLESNRILVRTTLDEGLPHACADPIQLQQVLVNLVTNAVEAMSSVADPELRRLELSSRRVDAQEVAIEVRDAGVGLGDVDRLFEPFFSTKPDGMGMGLAICRSIAEAHGGRLSAHANPGPGSTFRLALPVGREEPA
jgi:signal transduction histidine kinase